MTRLLLAVLLLSVTVGASGQQKKKGSFNNRTKAEKNKFLDKQWWLGFKAGANLSDAIPERRYTIVTPTNYNASATDKTYKAYSMTGAQVTLEVTFFFKNFSISTQPTYRHSRFSYFNQFNWTNTENAAERLELRFDQEQQIDYVDFPLLAKYEIDIASNEFTPFVYGGAFYSLLIDANKSVVESGTDYASGGTNAFKNEAVIVGAKDLFQNYWGLMAGAGLNYNLGNVRLVLDIAYRHGMSNIANPKTRFSNDRLSGIGDAQDDLLLRNITFSAGCLFPLRFLSSDFRSVDK